MHVERIVLSYDCFFYLGHAERRAPQVHQAVGHRERKPPPPPKQRQRGPQHARDFHQEGVLEHLQHGGVPEQVDGNDVGARLQRQLDETFAAHDDLPPPQWNGKT